MQQGGETNKQPVLVYLHLCRAALIQACEGGRKMAELFLT
jgi:hypothetical protein